MTKRRLSHFKDDIDSHGDREQVSFVRTKVLSNRSRGVVKVSTAVFKHLRHILFIPLVTGDLQAAVNLLNSGEIA